MRKLTKYTVLRRLALPFFLVLVVAASLWFSSPLPVKALTINFPTLPSTGTLGQTYSFNANVTVEDQDLLPIQSADLEIHNATLGALVVTCTGLPLSNNTTQNYSSANGSVTVYSNTGTGWGGASSASRIAYWRGYGYNLAVGYGYGYATGSANTSITYTITWSPPTSLPSGNYYAMVIVHGDNTQTFSETSTSFSLTSPGGGGPSGGGPGGGGPSGAGITNLTLYTNDEGVFNLPATAKSEDGKVQLTINKGTRARTRSDTRLTYISILKMTDPPAPSENTSIIGLVYNISPDGATFTPSITLTFTYDPAQVPDGVDQKKLVLATWDSVTSKWIESDNCTVDTTAHTISVEITHFTPFAIIAHTRPAALVVSGLTISPTEVNAGQRVTISVQVTNNGDFAGSSNLTLNVNNVAVATRDISVPGGTTQTVDFTTIQDTSGTYNVDVNGLSGTFVVKALSLPSPPAAFTTSALTISPTEVGIGGSVTISVRVVNNGEVGGSYEVILKIDNVVVATTGVTLDSGAFQIVSFTTIQYVARTYTVTIDGQSGTFTVKSTLPPPTVINWWLIGGIISVVVVIAMLILLSIRRRAASR
jgi:hypothetical protein